MVEAGGCRVLRWSQQKSWVSGPVKGHGKEAREPGEVRGHQRAAGMGLLREGDTGIQGRGTARVRSGRRVKGNYKGIRTRQGAASAGNPSVQTRSGWVRINLGQDKQERPETGVLRTENQGDL